MSLNDRLLQGPNLTRHWLGGGGGVTRPLEDFGYNSFADIGCCSVKAMIFSPRCSRSKVSSGKQKM